MFGVALWRGKRAWGGLWIFLYIRYLGDGLYRFRSYSESLLKGPKSNQKVLAPPLGASLRLGMPAHRLESVGRRDGPSLAQRG